VAALDNIFQRPENPKQTDLAHLDTKPLRVTKDLLEKSTLQEAAQFIESNSHTKLWCVYYLSKTN
jgi:hypothetical protein